MVRTRWVRVAVAAALGLACGCANACPDSFLYRVTHPFQTLSRRHEVAPPPDGPLVDGPMLVDPGVCNGPGWGPVPESVPPPLMAPPPRAIPQAQPMPATP
jgi:hypothetical protein